MPYDFRPFDLGAAQQRGAANAMAQMQTMGMADKLNRANTMRQLSQESAATGKDLADMARQAGYPEIANKLQAQRIKKSTAILGFLKAKAPMVRDQASLDAFNAEAKGMGSPAGSMPTQWNDNTKRYLSSLSGKAAAKLQTFSPGQRGYVLDPTTGEYVEKVRVPLSPRQRAKGKAAGTGEKRYKLAIQKEMRARVADLFGGFYDPVTNKIRGLSKTATKQIAGIMKRAEQLHTKDPSRNPQDYVNQAAKEAGIDIPGVTGGGTTTGGSVSDADIKPGEETATHPGTGERRVKRGGQWLKITP